MSTESMAAVVRTTDQPESSESSESSLAAASPRNREHSGAPKPGQSRFCVNDPADETAKPAIDAIRERIAGGSRRKPGLSRFSDFASAQAELADAGETANAAAGLSRAAGLTRRHKMNRGQVQVFARPVPSRGTAMEIN